MYQKIITIFIMLLIASSISLYAYQLYSPNNNILENKVKITDLNYMGWKGLESLVTPLSKYDTYALGVKNAYVHYGLYWPLVKCKYLDSNPFKCIVKDDMAIIIGTVLNIEGIKVYRRFKHVKIFYLVKIEKVIRDFGNTVPKCVENAKEHKECILYPNGIEECIDHNTVIEEINKKRDLASDLIIGNRIIISYPAWLTKEALDIHRENLTIEDIASPFPLLSIGNTYILFIKLTPRGLKILYDDVWGPYAYLIRNDKVYSLNYIYYPIKHEPEKFFSGDNVYWRPYDYQILRNISLEKLSVYGEDVKDFIEYIRSSLGD